jgi:outer membrane biosynthesis protein TonB
VDDEGGGGDEKVLVLISSLMAWDATPRKLEKIIQPGTEDPEEIAAVAAKAGSEEGDANSQEGSEKDEKEPEPEPEKEPSVKAPNSQVGSQEGSDVEEKVESEKEITESEEEEVKKKPIKRRYLNHAFTEEDYKTRQASSEYAIVKEVEDLVLKANRAGIKTYVVSAGVLYGKGEAIFNSHFKKAWL